SDVCSSDRRSRRHNRKESPAGGICSRPTADTAGAATVPARRPSDGASATEPVRATDAAHGLGRLDVVSVLPRRGRRTWQGPPWVSWFGAILADGGGRMQTKSQGILPPFLASYGPSPSPSPQAGRGFLLRGGTYAASFDQAENIPLPASEA